VFQSNKVFNMFLMHHTYMVTLVFWTIILVLSVWDDHALLERWHWHDTSIFTLLLYCSVHLVYSNTQCLLRICNTTEKSIRV